MTDRARVHVVSRPDRKYLTLRYIDPVTGKRHSKSAKTHRRSEAERAAARWEREIEEGASLSPSRATWSDFEEQVELDYVGSLATSSADRLRLVMRSYFSAAKPARMSAVSSDTIKQWVRHLRRRGVSEATVKSYSATLKAVLEWACETGCLDRVPAFPKAKRGRSSDAKTPMKGRPITDAEFQGMRNAVESVAGSERADCWLRLLDGLWLSGLRLSEALSLQWERSEEAMSVETSGRHTMLVVPAKSEKGNRDRLLPIAPQFADFLTETPLAERFGHVFPVGSPQPKVNWASRRITAFGEAAEIVVSSNDGKKKFASAHDLRR